MSNEITASEPKKAEKLTITLTDARPVTITKDLWPIIAESSWKDWDNTYESQANRTWSAWLKVRQHADGRTIVYGGYSHTTQFQNESGESYRDGERVDPSAEDYPESERAANYWLGEEIIGAIKRVGETLQGRSGSEHFADLIAECIADLPAEEIAE